MRWIKIAKFTSNLRELFKNIEDFRRIDKTRNISGNLGFEDYEEAWEKNPVVDVDNKMGYDGISLTKQSKIEY